MKNKSKKPQLTDFYDSSDPRGCSTSEYEDYLKVVKKWEKTKKEKNKKK